MEWAKSCGMCVDWVLVAALDTLYAWYCAKNPYDWKVEFAGPWSPTSDEVSIDLISYDGFDLDAYYEYLRGIFDREKERMMADARAKASTMRRARTFTKPERIDALVLRLCSNLDPDSIAVRIPGYNKHHSVIAKDLAEAAAYLGLDVPQGRRRKVRNETGYSLP